jgi:hypothetical protein
MIVQILRDPELQAAACESESCETVKSEMTNKQMILSQVPPEYLSKILQHSGEL